VASLRQILLRVTGDADDARAELRKTAAELRELSGMTAEARVELKTNVVEEQIARVQVRLANLSAQEATPEVRVRMARAVAEIERLQGRLAKLRSEDVTIDVDVKRGKVETAVAVIGDTIKQAVSGIGSAISQGFSTGISVIGSLASFMRGLAIIVAVALAPALILLGTSLLSAAAGAGVLAVALAGALGPAVLVAVAAMTRLAAIVAALKERHTQAAQQAGAVAGSQDQIRTATDALANAQDNLATQTSAAYQAWADAIEAVKDDLRDVEHAQLGIEGAQLRLARARQTLAAFRRETGTAGESFDALFKRFSDVNFRGDLSGIGTALSRAGGGLDNSDQLRLKEILHDIKEAKLGEKDANDSLHDSQVKLNRDRQTETDFARRGIQAYSGYRAAVQGAAAAQRALAAAQRQSNTALDRQNRLWDDLSPAEQRFALRLDHFQEAFRRAFGPATRALLSGLGKLLDTVSDKLRNPLVVAGLTAIGRSIGGVFRTAAREISRPEFQQAFARFTSAAARLIRELGSHAARDFFRILMRIGEEALPPLERGIRTAVRWLDRFTEAFTHVEERNRGFGAASNMATDSPLERFVTRVLRSFRTWLDITKELAGVVKGFLRAAGGEGQTLADNLRSVLRHWNDWINSPQGQQRMQNFFREVRKTAEAIATVFARLVKLLGGATSTAIKVADAVTHPGETAKSFGQTALDTLVTGRGRSGPSKDWLVRYGGLTAAEAEEWLRRHGRAKGGLVYGPGGNGRDNVLQPLEGGEFILRRAITQALGVPALSRLNSGDLPGFTALAGAAGGGGGMRIDEFHAHVTAPAGTSPDERTLLAKLEREALARGRSG
jgi:hypothetical protein